MRKSLVLAASVCLLLGLAPASAQGAKRASNRTSAFTIATSVNPEIIRAHVRFLSHDLLEGRGTGQRGGDIAAEYMGTMFAIYGLQPEGDNGTYMQKVPMVGVTTKPDSSFVLTTAKGTKLALKMFDQYVAMDESGATDSTVDAPIVWMGYGITAPEYSWDDYKGQDVKGKVLLMLVNEPPSNDPKYFGGKALTYYGRWTYKYEQAARMGAAGVILIHQTDMASYGWEVVRNSWGGERSYLRDTTDPRLKVASWIQIDVAKQLLADSGIEIGPAIQAAGKPGFQPQQLKAHLRAHILSSVRPFDSNNVLAMLPGSDPKLKSQAILYTAHYDHLGIDPDKKGDNIYKGALDNATGCAILLEMARVFSLASLKPRRSILFAAVTGEEQGLLGSEYLGKHPPIPANDISLNLNYDDIPPLGIPQEVGVSGAERTSFYPTVQTIAKDFKLTIVPDSRPEAGHYYRSDHFSLARVGIPAFSVTLGEKYVGHDREWGLKKEQEYLTKYYHQPTDEYRPDMDFRSNAVMARFGIALGLRAADQPAEIKWKSGDEFEKARLQAQRQ